MARSYFRHLLASRCRVGGRRHARGLHGENPGMLTSPRSSVTVVTVCSTTLKDWGLPHAYYPFGLRACTAGRCTRLSPGRCGRPGQRRRAPGLHPGCDASVWRCRSRRGENHGLHEGENSVRLRGMSVGHAWRLRWRASSGLPSSSLYRAPALPSLRLTLVDRSRDKTVSKEMTSCPFWLEGLASS